MSESTPAPAQGQTDATPTPAGEVRNYPAEWAKKKNLPLSSLYAALHVAEWDSNHLVTEAEFDAAVKEAGDITINAIHGPQVAR